MRPNRACASSAMRIRCSLVSSLNRSIRASSAVTAASAVAPFSSSTALSWPTTRISSLSTVTSGAPTKKSSGSRPANQALISARCSAEGRSSDPAAQRPRAHRGPGPRRPPRWRGRSCSCDWYVIVRDYMITNRRQARSRRNLSAGQTASAAQDRALTLVLTFRTAVETILATRRAQEGHRARSARAPRPHRSTDGRCVRPVPTNARLRRCRPLPRP